MLLSRSPGETTGLRFQRPAATCRSEQHLTAELLPKRAYSMSASRLIAVIHAKALNVRYVPEADILPGSPRGVLRDSWNSQSLACSAMVDGAKPLARYFPEVVETLGSLKPKQFVVNGELVIPFDGTMSC
jgi:hypothetical protein